MRVGTGADFVGYWSFDTPPLEVSEGQLDRLVRAFVTASDVLAAAQLLRPTVVTFERWIVQSGKRSQATNIPPLGLQLDGEVNSAQLVRKAEEHRRRHRNPDAVPVVIEVAGPGVVLDGNGQPHEEPTLCSLAVTPTGRGADITFTTHSDVWMPYDLTGKAQENLARRNAPRLSQALRDLADALGADPEPAEGVRHAVVRPNGLDNVRDINGDVCPTLEQ